MQLLLVLSRSHVWPIVIIAMVLVSGASPVAGQSLAEVARQEEARRKEIKQPAKVYTNKDLASVPSPSPPPQTAPSAASAADAAGKEAAGDPKGKDAKDPGVVKDQAYWSSRMKALTAQLDSDQLMVDALRLRISALTAVATSGPDLQRATDELDRLTQAVERDKQAIADFPEEARKASVPPGWLR
jgi:hypothetical protein